MKLEVAKANVRDELKWYKRHWRTLVKMYEGKVIVIKDHAVVGAYDSDTEAYFHAVQEKHFEPGTFAIQLCDKDGIGFTATFHSRV